MDVLVLKDGYQEMGNFFSDGVAMHSLENAGR
jgi:hypothetical protein